ncbi:hypothetical protein ACTXJR_07800 [Glutamicibacter ardleyensis]|uniref:hypothetical protein n=1 Tax=Glutamicibacter ardleyensis TaxID=225894 RepID=UPI003FD5A038
MTYQLFHEPNYMIVESNFGDEFTDLGKVKIDLSGFDVFFFDGIALSSKSILTSKSSQEVIANESLTSLANSNGEWAAAGIRNGSKYNEFLFFTDRFGYSPLFYSIIDQSKVVISNSFHGVIAGLSTLSVRCTLNVEHYAALVSSNTPTFQNTHSHNTMAKEVKMLPAQNALLIGPSGGRLIDRDLIGKVNEIGSYEDALNLGIQHSIDTLRVVSCMPELSRRITLTGGVDSRLCASLIAASGELSKFSVSTIDPRTWGSEVGKQTLTKDIVVSNSIRENYKLSWWHMVPRKQVSQSFMESLGCFQSYRSNLAFTFRPVSVHTRFEEPVLTIRGGGGEVIRTDSTIEKMASDYEAISASGSTDTLKESIWYAERQLQGSVLQGSLRERVLDSITNDFPIDYGSSFLERISKLYLDYRYRGHFGHQRQSTSANDLIMHPLSNPYFLKASKMIDYEELSRGKMVRDIFEKTTPEMLGLPFITEQWTELLSAGSDGPIDYESKNWKESLDSAPTRSAVKYSEGFAPEDRGEESSFDIHQSSIEFLKFAFARLENLIDEESSVLLASLHHSVLSRVESKKFIDGYAVAKAASALDVFYPQCMTGKSMTLTCIPRHADLAQESQLPNVVVNLPAFPQDGYHNLVLKGFVISLVRGTKGLTATVIPAGYSGPPVDFAYYLYCGSERITVKWYTSEDTMSFEFETPPKTGTYRVDAFMRTRSDEVLVHRASSNRIQVN